MSSVYGRDLDLNLLRVFSVVAEAGSVTEAASRLYLTQPAVSAALRRLQRGLGAPLFARQGRGLVLTERGRQLLSAVRPHLTALVEAALSPQGFDPKTSDRTIVLGLSDENEAWLLPALLRTLRREAPRMRVVVLPVQFRTVGEVLAARRVDAAVTVADSLPGSVRRRALFTGGFVCLFDPRHHRRGTAKKKSSAMSERDYLAREHVIVSYAGDLRGIVEDLVKKPRNVRVSVSSFHHVGPIVDGGPLVATVPDRIADSILRARPHLQKAKLPFGLPGTAVEMLWSAADDDDAAGRFVREKILAVVKTMVRT